MKNIRPKVLFISGSWPPIKCGVGDYLYHLTQHLDCDWHVVTSANAQPGERVGNIVSGWGFADWLAISNKIKTLRPDIIHYQYPSTQFGRKPFPNLLPRYIAKNFPDIPLVATIHEYHDASRLGRGRTEFTIRPFKNIFVSNVEDKQQLGRRFPNKQFEIVRVGSNIPVIHINVSERAKIIQEINPGNKPLIVYFGYIDSSKGVGRLIESMSGWGRDCRLVLATSHNPQDAYHMQLQKQIADSGMDIHWTDFLSAKKISVILQMADVVVLPFDRPVSMRRGSLIASMEHGCSIITTGPASEVLTHQQNCWLMPNNLPQSIAKAVSSLLEQSELVKLIGINAKKTSQQFSWKEIATRHYQQYQELLP